MLKYGKSAQNAISILSYLAVHYNGKINRFSSHEISEIRKLPQPVVAKLMTILSQVKILGSTKGPNGGYFLNREPSKVSLMEIVENFESVDDKLRCPFGPNWCGVREPCPLHNKLVEFEQQYMDFLSSTTLAIFQTDEKVRKN